MRVTATTVSRLEQALNAALEFAPVMQITAELVRFGAWFEAQALSSVLEIGTANGGTAAFFLALGAHVWSVDMPNGPGGASAEFYADRDRRLTARFPGRYVAVRGNSHDPYVRAALRCGVVDLLFIDGDHSYAGVMQDFLDYRPFVRRGGAVAFHDISDTAINRAEGCRVARFWNELRGHKLEFRELAAGWGGIGVWQS